MTRRHDRTTRRAARRAVATIALGLTAACGGSARGAATPAPAQGHDMAAMGGASSGGMAGMSGRASVGGTPAGIARAHADSVRLPWTAADARFMTSMIGHHAQAIVMARMAPTHDASPTVRTLAERIINAQRDEIATMQTWLRDRLQPAPEPEEVDAMGAMHGMHHGAAAGGMGGMDHALMPGMLTPAQLAQLDSARGPEFDRLFLTFMIQHHRGATSMVQALFGTYGAAQDETVFKFASDVNVDQTTEIARMQRMLAVLTLGAGAP